MPRKKSYPTITDQFCGCGGSSAGAKKALEKIDAPIDGLKLALNHWRLAVETHQTNFPDTLHDCADVSASDPRRYPSTTMLITSPECTTHSPAGGNFHKSHKQQMDLFDSGKIDPATERSRATMWDVCRFAEYHRYELIIVENVVEAKTRWELFDVWLSAMHRLGYEHECVYMNSMFMLPTPQSRDRMYIVFWKKGNKKPNLNFTPSAYCPRCEKNVLSVQVWKNSQRKFGKYNKQYTYNCPGCAKPVDPYYYAAFNCIDWSIQAQKIGERKKPLADKTMARIRFGYDKYGKTPLVISTRWPSGVECRVNTTNEILSTQPCAPAHGFLNPYLVYSGDNKSDRAYSMAGALSTQTTHPRMGIMAPPPFIIENFGTSKARGLNERIGAMTASGDNYGLIQQPVIIQTDHQGAGAHWGSFPAMESAVPTQKTWQTMGLVSNERFNAFLQYYYNGSNCLSGLTDATGTMVTKERAALVNIETATRLEDCTYRMLVPKEVQRAMAFDDKYIVLGNGKDQVRQLGNAVTPPVMEWLVTQCLETLK